MPKKTSALDCFRENLEALITETGWSNREIARRSKGDITDRYIGMIRNQESSPTIESADAIAKAFGLSGWQMMVPHFVADMARDGRLEKLIRNYSKTTDEGRNYIDRVAEREAGYHPPDKPGKGKAA